MKTFEENTATITTVAANKWQGNIYRRFPHFLYCSVLCFILFRFMKDLGFCPSHGRQVYYPFQSCSNISQ